MTPEELQAYYPIAEENAHANLERASQKAGREVGRLNQDAIGVGLAVMPIGQKMKRLRFIAGQWSSHLTPHTACSKACTHCCHVAVSLTSAEAQIIAKQIGVKVAKPTTLHQVSDSNPDEAKWLGVPCTFLGENGCQVYDARPLMCRTLVNMDSDERLCRIDKNATINVPYANATSIKGAMVFIAQKDAGIADVREWFPEGLRR